MHRSLAAKSLTLFSLWGGLFAQFCPSASRISAVRLILPTLLLLSALIPAAPTASAAMVRLNQSVTVTENYVRLGDIFLGLDDRLSGIPVIPAPEKGKQMVLSGVQLGNIADQYNIDWRPTSRHQNVTVSRSDQIITSEMMVNRLESALRSQGVDGNLKIELDGRPAAIHIPGSRPASLGMEKLDYDQETGRFQALLIAAIRDDVIQRIPLSGRAYSMIAVPVLNRRMGPDDVIRDRDIEWKKIRTSRVHPETIRDLEQLVGRSPRRWARPGDPLRADEVQAALIVKKGTIVSMVVRTPHMTLTAQGKALDSGSMGQAIRVINTSTNRTIYATVTRPDVVSVKLSDIGEFVAN